ncbi:helix-turn-helix transcriptional regulator [candidate division KSB1 bacterium]|nr:helix-turn-helix transcriptional regulator [candidate division KSB1 bacterium]
MLEHTKKRHTKRIVLTFFGPISERDKAIKLMESIGFKDASDSMQWENSFPEFKDNSAGVVLAGARYKEGLTQRQLSDLTGIPQRHISEMENGKRTIGRKNARLLSDALKIDYKTLM